MAGEKHRADGRKRCSWCGDDALLTAYHDDEWGVPIEAEDAYLERLALEMFQAGLSWRLMLVKREAFRRAFAGFDAERVAAFTRDDVERLLADAGIVRNRRKIEAVIHNARAFIEIRREFGSFHAWLYRLPDDQGEILRAFKGRFKFMGPLVVESFLESVGRIPAPHDEGCWAKET